VAIEVCCKNCRALLLVPATAEGKRIRCPRCSRVQWLTSASVDSENTAPDLIASSTTPTSHTAQDSHQDASTLHLSAVVTSKRSRRPFPAWLHWSVAILAILVVMILGFIAGRAANTGFPLIHQKPTANIKSNSSQGSPETPTVGTQSPETSPLEDELSSVRILPPVMSLGNRFEEDSEPFVGQRLTQQQIPENELGRPHSALSSPGKNGDHLSLMRAELYLRVSERRNNRFRAVNLLRPKPGPEVKKLPPYRILQIIPSLNSAQNNADWVFLRLNFEDSLITDSGKIIQHPDHAETERLAIEFRNGTAGPGSILESLRSMRYPSARREFFRLAGTDTSLSVSQRRLYYGLLTCPVIHALLFDAEVESGSISVKPTIPLPLPRIDGMESQFAHQLLNVISSSILTDHQSYRQLRKAIWRGKTPDDDDPKRLSPTSTLDEWHEEILKMAWDQSSTEALVQLLTTLNGMNRSAQLRRLFRERILTELQRDALVNANSSTREIDALIGKVPVQTLISMTTADRERTTHSLSELAKTPGLEQHDADEIAKATFQLTESSEAWMVLRHLRGKASTGILATAHAIHGNTAEVQSLLESIREPKEKSEVAAQIIAALPEKISSMSVLLILAPYGNIDTLIAMGQKVAADNQSPEEFIRLLERRGDISDAQKKQLRLWKERQQIPLPKN
jgi:hypothetical protein